VEVAQDIFISHAGADKDKYINPMAYSFSQNGISYWLDNVEISWGDNIALSINRGLRLSRFVLVCLSSNYVRRPWPESEMSYALASQNATGQKRVLPLILDSKDAVLKEYPLLAALAYREYKNSPDEVAKELGKLLHGPSIGPGELHVSIESVHTGQSCHIRVPGNVSVQWLSAQAQSGLGLTNRADTGGFLPFGIRWVLVDSKAEKVWQRLSRSRKRRVRAIIQTEGGPKICMEDFARLNDIGTYDGLVLHLYAIEDEDYGPPPAASAPV
jgi:hypothetical protein